MNSDHGAVDPDVVEARHALRLQADQQLHAPDREQQPEAGAEER